MVKATAVPMRAPASSHTAARAMPWLAVITLVATTVAMELAASWKPLTSSKTKATRMTRKTKATAAVMALASGMFQHDVEDDVADVPAAVEDFFDQFVKVLQDDDVDGAVVAGVKSPQNFHHEFIRFAFDLLEGVVLGFDFLDVDALAKFFDEEQDGVGGLFQHAEVGGQLQVGDMFSGDDVALAKFLRRLWNLVQRIGEGFDVLPFQRGDEGLEQVLGQFLGDAFVLAARLHEAGQGPFLRGGLDQLDDIVDTGARFFRAAFHEREEFVVFAQ